MFETIDREHVRRLVEEGAQVVEVLETSQFGRAHLPGAIHIPAWEMTRERASTLDPDRPVVVYCFDTL
ncbi:MAG: rhodanese-like domain-containing protein [Acidimicrobiales bacterium]